MRAFALVLAALLPGLALAQTPATPPPLRFVGTVEKVVVTQDGTAQSLYKASPGKPLRMSTSGAMTLVLTARPLIDKSVSKPSPVSITILVAGTGSAPVIAKDSLAVDGMRGEVTAALAAGPSKTIRLPIPTNAAMVEISAEGAGVAIAFSRTAYVAPVASLEPSLDDSVLAAIPMIRKSVEKFSVGAKAGVVVPGGADLGWGGGSQNLYAGGELRFTPPQLERRLSICLESGIYELHESRTIVATQPIGSNDAGDLSRSTRIVPLLLGASWRVPIGEETALHAGAGAGMGFTRRIESVRFRSDRTTTGSVGAGYLRFAADRKIGRGRVLALEGTWLHAAGDDPTYLGGFVTTLHYRVTY